jgi:hypothetical protein
VILFRGTGADACRYLESDRSTADDYYLEGGTARAQFTVLDGTGTVTDEGVFTPADYWRIGPVGTGSPRIWYRCSG